jgi:hypothetical protein
VTFCEGTDEVDAAALVDGAVSVVDGAGGAAELGV